MAGLMPGMPGGAPIEAPESMANSVAMDAPSRGMAPSDGDVDGEAPNVTEEEQAEYERLVHEGLGLIHVNGKIRPGILELLDDDPSDLIEMFGQEVQEGFGPKTALAATTAVVCLEIARRNPDIDGGILLHVGVAMLEDLAEVSESATGAEFSQDDLNAALLIALDLFREAGVAEGMVDRKDLDEDFRRIQEADRTGDLSVIGMGR